MLEGGEAAASNAKNLVSVEASVMWPTRQTQCGLRGDRVFWQVVDCRGGGLKTLNSAATLRQRRS